MKRTTPALKLYSPSGYRPVKMIANQARNATMKAAKT
jgi:hypothetical protein